MFAVAQDWARMGARNKDEVITHHQTLWHMTPHTHTRPPSMFQLKKIKSLRSPGFSEFMVFHPCRKLFITFTLFPGSLNPPCWYSGRPRLKTWALVLSRPTPLLCSVSSWLSFEATLGSHVHKMSDLGYCHSPHPQAIAAACLNNSLGLVYLPPPGC